MFILVGGCLFLVLLIPLDASLFKAVTNTIIGSCGVISVLLCYALIITIIVLLFTAYQPVEWDEYAVQYNKITYELDTTKIYTPSYYYIFPDKMFFKYKSTAILVNDQELKSRTNDGVPISFVYDFSYRFNQSTMLDVFKEFEYNEDGIKAFMIKEANGIILNAVGGFRSQDIQDHRIQFSNALYNNLTEYFPSFASLIYINIGFVKVSANFENAINEKITEQQNVELVGLQREVEETLAQKLIITANKNKAIKKINAETNAKILGVQVNTYKSLLEIRLANDKEAINKVKTTHGFTQNNSTLSYLWYDTLINNAANLTIYPNLGTSYKYDLQYQP
mmetsp:Transcript_7845/g.11641  ORF Transcript_7845/g.11641 Transcript_7845/m.11641 type:complete len:336 (+) Transcript_7845:55-1062(+)